MRSIYKEVIMKLIQISETEKETVISKLEESGDIHDSSNRKTIMENPKGDVLIYKDDEKYYLLENLEDISSLRSKMFAAIYKVSKNDFAKLILNKGISVDGYDGQIESLPSVSMAVAKQESSYNVAELARQRSALHGKSDSTTKEERKPLLSSQVEEIGNGEGIISKKPCLSCILI